MKVNTRPLVNENISGMNFIVSRLVQFLHGRMLSHDRTMPYPSPTEEGIEVLKSWDF